MTEDDLNNLSENLSIRFSKRDLLLLEQISGVRGCSSSDFIRSLIRAAFKKLAYLRDDEKKAVGEVCPLCGGPL